MIQHQVTREQQQRQETSKRDCNKVQVKSSQVQTTKSKKRHKEEDYYCMFIVIVLSKIHVGNNVYV